MEKETTLDYYINLIEELQDFPEVCDFKKRRKCDSLYIKRYNTLLEAYKRLLSISEKKEKEVESLKLLLHCYHEVLDNTVKEVTGKVVR